ncbi:transposase [Ferruginibacter sp.]
MAIRYKHSDIYSMYFCTFTCCNWINLFEISNTYDAVYTWFKVLKDKYNCDVVAYVIMPNHVHCILYFKDTGFDLNKIISNGKRFMAYEIITQLKDKGATDVLKTLSDALTAIEKRKVNCIKFLKIPLTPRQYIRNNF